MAAHRFLIDALNAIAVNTGGSGGHRYMIDALNEWAVLLGGAGGHKYTIDALNVIAVQAGGAGGHRYDINALNAISVALTGTGGHTYYIDALNEIVDLDTGGGGGGYVATAAQFTGSGGSVLASSGLGIADTPYFSISRFVLWDVTDWAGLQLDINDTFDDDFDIFLEPSGDPPDQTFQLGSGFYPYPNAGKSLTRRVSFPSFENARWFWLAAMCDTDHDTPNKVMRYFCNGVEMADGAPNIDQGGAFDMGFSAYQFHIPSASTSPFSGALAEYWFAPGQFVDFSQPLVQAKFWQDGKPVFLGADGSLPTGTAPAVFFSKNNQDSLPFSHNRGTGSAFTTTGGEPPDATTSPSD